MNTINTINTMNTINTTYLTYLVHFTKCFLHIVFNILLYVYTLNHFHIKDYFFQQLYQIIVPTPILYNV